MSLPTFVVLFFVSALVLQQTAATPISNRDRAALQAEVLEDLLEKVAEEMQVRAIEREILERSQETEEAQQLSQAPAKRDTMNEKRNLSRLAQMGARGFGRRRR